MLVSLHHLALGPIHHLALVPIHHLALVVLLDPFYYNSKLSVDKQVSVFKIVLILVNIVIKVQIKGQRDLLFQFRDKDENFSFSISHIENSS